MIIEEMGDEWGNEIICSRKEWINEGHNKTDNIFDAHGFNTDPRKQKKERLMARETTASPRNATSRRQNNLCKCVRALALCRLNVARCLPHEEYKAKERQDNITPFIVNARQQHGNQQFSN